MAYDIIKEKEELIDKLRNTRVKVAGCHPITNNGWVALIIALLSLFVVFYVTYVVRASFGITDEYLEHNGWLRLLAFAAFFLLLFLIAGIIERVIERPFIQKKVRALDRQIEEVQIELARIKRKIEQG